MRKMSKYYSNKVVKLRGEKSQKYVNIHKVMRKRQQFMGKSCKIIQIF